MTERIVDFLAGVNTAILMPVLNRSHRIRPLVENIEQVTRQEHRIVFAVSAADVETIRAIAQLGFDGLAVNVIMSPDGGGTWPERINRLYREARLMFSDLKYIFTGADDLLFHEDWLEEAQATMSTLPDQSGVVVVNDLYNPNGTMALIAVDYIERFGATADGTPGVVMGPYQHNWSDTELIEVARRRGRHARAFSSIVEHLHHGAGKAPFDETYALGLRSELQDRQLFMSRQRLIRRLT